MLLKNNPIFFLLKKLWEYSEGNRRNVVLYFVLFFFANIFSLIMPLVVGKILNVIQEQGVSAENVFFIIMYLSVYFVLKFITWCFHGPARIIEKKNAFLVRLNYKQYFINGTMNLPIAWHTDNHSGDTIDKIEKATNALYSFSENSYIVIEVFVKLIVSFFTLMYFNLHAGYIVLFVTILSINVIVRYDKILIPKYRELYKAENKVSAKVYDVISNITTVVILRIEKLLSASIKRKMFAPFELYHRTNKIEEFKWFLVSMSIAFMIFFVIATYIYTSFRAGEVILLGTVYVLYNYMEVIAGVFYNFALEYSEMVVQKTAIENSLDVSNQFKLRKRVGAIDLKKCDWNVIRIRDLNFSYHTEDGADLSLDNVSIDIGRNEKIAFIGESGSGKTTMLKVIRELYDVIGVNVYLDDVLLDYDFKSISSNITLIPQEPEIFTTTIRENITMGIKFNMDILTKYSDMACFTQVVKKLPSGFDSSIVEKGVNLSGGEKQRLALVRGLVAARDKSIVLLDEPTSSVDAKNELKIYENIFEEFKDKTIISSIHRLHLLSMFDKIYYFKNGKVIASGSLKELLEESKDFKKLWKKYIESNKVKK